MVVSVIYIYFRAIGKSLDVLKYLFKNKYMKRIKMFQVEMMNRINERINESKENSWMKQSFKS